MNTVILLFFCGNIKVEKGNSILHSKRVIHQKKRSSGLWVNISSDIFEITHILFYFEALISFFFFTVYWTLPWYHFYTLIHSLSLWQYTKSYPSSTQQHSHYFKITLMPNCLQAFYFPKAKYLQSLLHVHIFLLFEDSLVTGTWWSFLHPWRAAHRLNANSELFTTLDLGIRGTSTTSISFSVNQEHIREALKINQIIGEPLLSACRHPEVLKLLKC